METETMNPVPSSDDEHGTESGPYNGFGDRLKSVRGGMTLPEFAKLIGISRSTLIRYESGEREPDLSLLLQLCTQFSLSIKWLAAGEGGMHKGAEFAVGSDIVHVPEYNVEVSMGPGAQNGDEEVIAAWPFAAGYLDEVGIRPDKACLVSARGDSMSPTINNGDSVLVDRSYNRVKGEGIYVVRLGDELFAKRIQPMSDGGLVIRSDNPAYEPEVIPADKVDQLYIRGRVASRLGRL